MTLCPCGDSKDDEDPGSFTGRGVLSEYRALLDLGKKQSRPEQRIESIESLPPSSSSTPPPSLPSTPALPNLLEEMGEAFQKIGDEVSQATLPISAPQPQSLSTPRSDSVSFSTPTFQVATLTGDLDLKLAGWMDDIKSTGIPQLLDAGRKY